MLWWPWVYIAGTYICHYTLYTLDTHVMMTLGIHCWYLSISLYLIYPWYTLLWWPCVYIVMITLGIHCIYFSRSLHLIYPRYTLLWWPWIHFVMMTLEIHCWYLYISFYLIYPGYTLLWWPWRHMLWWPWVYNAGTYLYHYSWYTLDTHFMMTLDTHVMMSLVIHCWYLSMSLYLINPGYTCYDDPGYTLLVLIYVIIPYIPWIHMLWWPWVYIAGTYLYHYTLYSLDTHRYDDPAYTLLWWPWVYIAFTFPGHYTFIYPGYTL